MKIALKLKLRKFWKIITKEQRTIEECITQISNKGRLGLGQ